MVNKRAKTRRASAKAYDNLLLSLASGGLVLTVGFVKDLVHLATARDLYLLFCSWTSFALALFITLIGYVLAIEEEKVRTPGRIGQDRPLKRLTRIANLSLTLLGFGVLFFLVFIMLNVPVASSPASGQNSPQLLAAAAS